MSLQFDTAPTNCAVCKKPVAGAYYMAGKAVVCADCKAHIETAKPRRPTPALVWRASLLGVGGAILGAALYYVVIAATGYEISLVAIAVGYIVGRAVQLGANGQRSRVLQVIAVALTYCGIATGYALVERTVLSTMAPAQVVAFVLSLPVRASTRSIITAFIVVAGMAQAWMMNRPATLPVFHGPFKIGAPA